MRRGQGQRSYAFGNGESHDFDSDGFFTARDFGSKERRVVLTNNAGILRGGMRRGPHPVTELTVLRQRHRRTHRDVHLLASDGDERRAARE